MGNCELVEKSAHLQTPQGEKAVSEQQAAIRVTLPNPSDLSRSQKSSVLTPVLPVLDCGALEDDIATAASPASSERVSLPIVSTTSLREQQTNLSRKVMIVSSDFKAEMLDFENGFTSKQPGSKHVSFQERYKLHTSKSFESRKEANVFESSIGELPDNLSDSSQHEATHFRKIGSSLEVPRFKHIASRKPKSLVFGEQDKFRQIFESIDTDKDGKIYARDMIKLVKSKSPMLSENEILNQLQFLEMAVKDSTNHQRDFWYYDDFKRYFSGIAAAFDSPNPRK